MSYLHVAIIQHADGTADSNYVSLDGRAWAQLVGPLPKIDSRGYISNAEYSEIKRIYFPRPLILGAYPGVMVSRSILEHQGGNTSWRKLPVRL